MNYQIILYYNFAKIDNLEMFCADHRRKCRTLNLFGRIYVAKEGINGTLAGTKEEIAQYKEFLCSLPGFETTQFKDDFAEAIPFQKLIVRIRDEIVTLKAEDEIDLNKESCNHLNPQQWRKVLESNEEYTLIDVRNNYESEIGHFEGAIRPDVKNFYDFPEWLDNANLDKDKKVLMYCTGGIRCEKFSVFMKHKGFKDIHQLYGGIINYAKEQGDAHYKGKCFVFDDRLAVPIEKDQKEPMGKCELTGKPCDTYINCSNMDCNKLFLCSEEGVAMLDGCCSEECHKAPKRRPLNPDNVYAPSLKWYRYFDEEKWESIKEQEARDKRQRGEVKK